MLAWGVHLLSSLTIGQYYFFYTVMDARVAYFGVEEHVEQCGKLA